MTTTSTGNGSNRTRVYVVRNSARFPDAGHAPVRLIRSYGRGGATAFAARDLFDVRLATQEDLEALLPKGVPVERAEVPQDDEPAADPGPGV